MSYRMPLKIRYMHRRARPIAYYIAWSDLVAGMSKDMSSRGHFLSTCTVTVIQTFDQALIVQASLTRAFYRHCQLVNVRKSSFLSFLLALSDHVWQLVLHKLQQQKQRFP